nr:hypothetical protein [Arenibacter sp. 6A1]
MTQHFIEFRFVEGSIVIDPASQGRINDGSQPFQITTPSSVQLPRAHFIAYRHFGLIAYGRLKAGKVISLLCFGLSSSKRIA